MKGAIISSSKIGSNFETVELFLFYSQEINMAGFFCFLQGLSYFLKFLQEGLSLKFPVMPFSSWSLNGTYVFYKICVSFTKIPRKPQILVSKELYKDAENLENI